MTDRTDEPTATTPAWDYEQPQAVLDLAWDKYMDLSLEPPPAGAPSMIDLSVYQHVPVHVISRLFDVAITAYREATEGKAG